MNCIPNKIRDARDRYWIGRISSQNSKSTFEFPRMTVYLKYLVVPRLFITFLLHFVRRKSV